MNHLLSNLPVSEITRLSHYKVIGEWDIMLPAQKMSKELLIEVAEKFGKCFPWVVYKEMLIAEFRESISNTWKDDSSVGWKTWLEKYDFQPRDLEDDIFRLYFNINISTSQGGEINFPHDRHFGELTLHIEEYKISITLYLNLFTKAAFPNSDERKPGDGVYMDIGSDSRQHNRKILSVSLACFATETKGEVTHSFSEKCPTYITLNGFSEQCEYEKYSTE
ncbi:hypothetical protein BH11BAC7_BH11BAC7_35070 [soil metagenome]